MNSRDVLAADESFGERRDSGPADAAGMEAWGIETCLM